MIFKKEDGGEIVLGSVASTIALTFAVVIGIWSLVQIFIFIDPFLLLHVPIIFFVSILSVIFGVVVIIGHVTAELSSKSDGNARPWILKRSIVPKWIDRLSSRGWLITGVILTLSGAAVAFASYQLGTRKTEVEIAQEELRARGMNFSINSFQNALYFQNKLALDLFFKAGINLKELYNALEQPADFTQGKPLLEALLEEIDCGASLDEKAKEFCTRQTDQFLDLLDQEREEVNLSDIGFVQNLYSSLVNYTFPNRKIASESGNYNLTTPLLLRQINEDGKTEILGTAERSILSYALQYRAGHVAAALIDKLGPTIVEEHWLNHEFLDANGDAAIHNHAMVDPFLLLRPEETGAGPKWTSDERERLLYALCQWGNDKWRPLGLARGYLGADGGCHNNSLEVEPILSERQWRTIEIISGEGKSCSIAESTFKAANVHHFMPDDVEREIFEGEHDGRVAILRKTPHKKRERQASTELDEEGAGKKPAEASKDQMQFFIMKTAEEGDPLRFQYYHGDTGNDIEFRLGNRNAFLRLRSDEHTTQPAADHETVRLRYVPPEGSLIEDLKAIKGSGKTQSKTTAAGKSGSANQLQTGEGEKPKTQTRELILDPISLLLESVALNVKEEPLSLELTLDLADSQSPNEPLPLCLEIRDLADDVDPIVFSQRAIVERDRSPILSTLLRPGDYRLTIAVGDVHVEKSVNVNVSFKGLAPRGLDCSTEPSEIKTSILLADETVARGMSIGGQEQYFCRFLVEGGKEVAIEVSEFGDVDLDFDILAYDHDGTGEVLRSATSGSPIERLKLALREGAYFLKLRAAGGLLDKASVAFNILGEADFGDDPEAETRHQAFELALDSISGDQPVEVHTGEISEGDAGDYFSFVLDEDQEIAFELEGLQNDIDIELFNENGSSIGSGGSVSLEFEKDLGRQTFEAGQRYFLRVYSIGESSSGYKLTARMGAASIGTENGAELPQPAGSFRRESDLGKLSKEDFLNLSGRVAAESEAVYLFEMIEEGPVTLTLAPLESDADLYLRTIGGAELEKSERLELEEDSFSRLLRAGRYLAVVKGLDVPTDYRVVIDHGGHVQN